MHLPTTRSNTGAQNIALAKAFVAGAREHRMIGDRALDRQAAEPAIGHVDLQFRAKLALGTNGEDVADDQHAQHQFGIDRGPACMAVIRCQFSPQPT